MIIIRINNEFPPSAQLYNDFVHGEYISMNLVKDLRIQNRLNKLKDPDFIRNKTEESYYDKRAIYYLVKMKNQGKVLKLYV